MGFRKEIYEKANLVIAQRKQLAEEKALSNKYRFYDVCERGERIETMVGLLNGYFDRGAHHLNVNVLNRSLLEDAYENPEKYPSLTVRVSGYAVRFNALSKNHQKEVIARTFHQSK